VVRLFPDTKPAKRGIRNPIGKTHGVNSEVFGEYKSQPNVIQGHEDNGGSASRFFKSCPYEEGEGDSFAYFPKASKKDRNEGLEGFEERDSMKWSGGNEKMSGLAGKYPDGTPRPKQKQTNSHPTVKPTSLMQYLVRLVTPV